MARSIRYFRANADGSLARTSLAQMQRWSQGEPLPAPLAAEGELKFLEAIVEVDGRQVMRVFRIMAFRHPLRRNGKLDNLASMSLAGKRLGLLERLRERRSEEAGIELLEDDANSYWWPTDAQLIMVNVLLFSQRPSPKELADLRGKAFRPDDARFS